MSGRSQGGVSGAAGGSPGIKPSLFSVDLAQ